MALRLCLQTSRRAGYLRRAAHCRWSSSLLLSDLGVRESLPPDHHAPQSNDPELSDQEWEIRTGRAINVIKQTLPEFFSIGLVTSVDKATGEPRSSASIVTPVIATSPPAVDDDAEQIYSPKIRLSYTPPDPLPAPFPKTFKAEGLSLYLMSSVFVRHTFNVLYTDVQVAMNKVTVNDPTTGLPYTPPADFPGKRAAHKRREKSLFVGLTVHGTSRMTGTLGEWEVNSTYTFSPMSGLVHTHTVNSIHPAPHQAVYESLRLSLSNVFGFDSTPKPQIEPATKRSV